MTGVAWGLAVFAYLLVCVPAASLIGRRLKTCTRSQTTAAHGAVTARAGGREQQHQLVPVTTPGVMPRNAPHLSGLRGPDAVHRNNPIQ